MVTRTTMRLAVLVAGSLFLATCVSAPPTRQAQVHAMGKDVMPFDLDKTLHSFQMTVEGGIQEVRLHNSTDADQLELIRHHLLHESMLFAQGQYTDPASLHGEDMPGLKELEAGATNVQVTYTELPDGARLTFSTEDPQLVLAIHKWFSAQLADHGPDAMQM